jgi:hypothetical protein
MGAMAVSAIARRPTTRIAAIEQSFRVDTVIDPDLQSTKRRQSAAISTSRYDSQS